MAETKTVVFLVDGPAEGHYETDFTEAPRVLHAVYGGKEPAVLDEPGDARLPNESLQTYYLQGKNHLCGEKVCHVTYSYSVEGTPDFHLQGVYDFTLQDALEAAAEDVDYLDEAGVAQWSALLLNLEAGGWKLTRTEPPQDSGTEGGSDG